MSHRPRAFRNHRSTTLTIEETSPAITEPSLPSGKILACLVGHNGLWAAYVATPESIQDKKQPTFFTGYSFVSELKKALAGEYPAFDGAFIESRVFWEKLGEAGIAMPETMPHREKEG